MATGGARPQSAAIEPTVHLQKFADAARVYLDKHKKVGGARFALQLASVGDLKGALREAGLPARAAVASFVNAFPEFVMEVPASGGASFVSLSPEGDLLKFRDAARAYLQEREKVSALRFSIEMNKIGDLKDALRKVGAPTQRPVASFCERFPEFVMTWDTSARLCCLKEAPTARTPMATVCNEIPGFIMARHGGATYVSMREHPPPTPGCGPVRPPAL